MQEMCIRSHLFSAEIYIRHHFTLNTSNISLSCLVIFFSFNTVYAKSSILFQVLLQDMQMECAADKGDLITEVADSLADLKRYDYALKFYLLLEGIAGHDNVR